MKTATIERATVPADGRPTQQQEATDAIRAIVTAEYLEEQIETDWAVPRPEFKQAVVLCHHLRPDRLPEAIFVHRVFLAHLHAELDWYGFPTDDNRLPELLDLITVYIDAEGLAWDEGRWTPGVRI